MPSILSGSIRRTRLSGLTLSSERFFVMDSERRSGRLWVTTMQELAAYCEARERLKLRAEQGENSLTLHLESSLNTSQYGAPEVTLLIPTPSTPRSAWLELIDGRHVPVDVRFVSGGFARVMVNVPMTAKALQLRT